MGWSIALAAERVARRTGRPSPWWLPTMVALSYLPDVVAQLLLLAGVSWGAAFGHSLLVAAVMGTAVAPLAKKALGVSFRGAVVLTLASLVLHIGADALQAPGRLPLWPLAHWACCTREPLLPSGLWSEAAVFGAPLLVLLPWRAHRRQTERPVTAPPALVWAGAAIAAALVGAAAATHALRDRREIAMERATRLVQENRYRDALLALDQAERWPSTAKPGRIEYLRAESHGGLGDRQRAEGHYLRSYETDPTYFWVIADLAVFYASAPAPEAERRARAAPWIDLLQGRFAGHPALPDALARVRRALDRR
jgi:membrane-bound metal-dependent hydrolase YbcI (DUF457 family)